MAKGEKYSSLDEDENDDLDNPHGISGKKKKIITPHSTSSKRNMLDDLDPDANDGSFLKIKKPLEIEEEQEDDLDNLLEKQENDPELELMLHTPKAKNPEDEEKFENNLVKLQEVHKDNLIIKHDATSGSVSFSPKDPEDPNNISSMVTAAAMFIGKKGPMQMDLSAKDMSEAETILEEILKNGKGRIQIGSITIAGKVVDNDISLNQLKEAVNKPKAEPEPMPTSPKLTREERVKKAEEEAKNLMDLDTKTSKPKNT